MGGWSNRYWVCPFFLIDEKYTIKCEGGSRVEFINAVEKSNYSDRYCCSSRWGTCTVADMLARRYREGK